MLKRLAVAVLLLSGPAAAQNQPVREVYPNPAQVGEAIAARCAAAWPDDEAQAEACRTAQADAYVALSEVVPGTPAGAAAGRCTQKYGSWQEIDWVEAKKCLDER